MQVKYTCNMDGMWLGYGFCPFQGLASTIIFRPQRRCGGLFFSAELPPSSGLDLAILVFHLGVIQSCAPNIQKPNLWEFYGDPQKTYLSSTFSQLQVLGEFEGSTTRFITSSNKKLSINMIRYGHVLCIYTVGGLFSERIWQVYWVDLHPRNLT